VIKFEYSNCLTISLNQNINKFARQTTCDNKWPTRKPHPLLRRCHHLRGARWSASGSFSPTRCRGPWPVQRSSATRSG